MQKFFFFSIIYIVLDLGKVDQKKDRKRKVDKSTPARIPEIADKKITTENDKKKMSPPKETPKKGIWLWLSL